MTFKQLEAFYWAATLLNFSSAAEQLGVTQPTMSKRIAELETEFGEVLFQRNNQRPILTGAGNRLLAHIVQIINVAGRIRAEFDAPDTAHGACRLGVCELVAITWFPRLARKVRWVTPGLTLAPHLCQREP